jgi:hypothetical protein
MVAGQAKIDSREIATVISIFLNLVAIFNTLCK